MKNESINLSLWFIVGLMFAFCAVSLVDNILDSRQLATCVHQYNGYYSSTTDTVNSLKTPVTDLEKTVASIENQEKETRKMIDRQQKFISCVYSRI